MNAATYFIDRHVLEGRGENSAIEFDEQRITYRELSEKINSFGNGLRKLGVHRGDRVLLLTPDAPEFFIGFFGVIKIGAVPVPLNTLLNATEYEYFLNDAGATILITTDALTAKIKAIPEDRRGSLQQIIVVGKTSDSDISFAELLEANSAELFAEPVDEDDVAFLLYSSGSTGAPKGCVHRQRDMVIAAEQYAKGVLGMTEKDKCFSVSKLFFAYGLGNSLFCPLSVGATTILMPGPPKPEAIFTIVERYQPTLFFSVPSNYLKLLEYADEAKRKPNFSSVRAFTSAGEPLPVRLAARLQEKFGREVLDSIGATELFIFAANRPGANRPGSAGPMLPTYGAKIVDDQGQTVKIGSVGSLIVQSETVCASYWNQPEKTAQAIDGNWFRTGDKCYQDVDGYLWYVGRADDMFKSNGAWVSPLEVENIFLEHPSVHEAAIIGRKDENELMKPMAYLVLQEGISGSPELLRELEQFAKDRLPGYKRPQWITFVSQLPRTTTGKLQRFKLREMING